MNFKDQVDCYQAIGAVLASKAPAGWREIEAAITLSDARVDAVVSCTTASGQREYLTGVPMLARHFYELARLVSTEDKGLYKTCDFKLLASGKYESNFAY